MLLAVQASMLKQRSESVLARVSEQLSQIERRDWELWVVVSLTGLLVSAALLAILFHAAFLSQQSIHFELTVSRPLAVGLFVLLALLNTYLVTKRFEVRRLREQLISSALQKPSCRAAIIHGSPDRNLQPPLVG